MSEQTPIRVMTADQFTEWHRQHREPGWAPLTDILNLGAPFTWLDSGNFRWTCPDCGSPYLAQVANDPVSGWDSPRWMIVYGEFDNNPTATPSLGCAAMKSEPGHHWWLSDGVLVPA